MQKKKVAGFMRALELINKGENIRDAIKKCGLSATTYYKYEKIFGDQVSPTSMEVLPQQQRIVPVVSQNTGTGFSIDEYKRLLEENGKLKDIIINKELNSLH